VFSAADCMLTHKLRQFKSKSPQFQCFFEENVNLSHRQHVVVLIRTVSNVAKRGKRRFSSFCRRQASIGKWVSGSGGSHATSVKKLSRFYVGGDFLREVQWLLLGCKQTVGVKFRNVKEQFKIFYRFIQLKRLNFTLFQLDFIPILCRIFVKEYVTYNDKNIKPHTKVLSKSSTLKRIRSWKIDSSKPKSYPRFKLKISVISSLALDSHLKCWFDIRKMMKVINRIRTRRKVGKIGVRPEFVGTVGASLGMLKLISYLLYRIYLYVALLLLFFMWGRTLGRKRRSKRTTATITRMTLLSHRERTGCSRNQELLEAQRDKDYSGTLTSSFFLPTAHLFYRPYRSYQFHQFSVKLFKCLVMAYRVKHSGRVIISRSGNKILGTSKGYNYIYVDRNNEKKTWERILVCCAQNICLQTLPVLCKCKCYTLFLSISSVLSTLSISCLEDANIKRTAGSYVHLISFMILSLICNISLSPSCLIGVYKHKTKNYSRAYSRANSKNLLTKNTFKLIVTSSLLRLWVNLQYYLKVRPLLIVYGGDIELNPGPDPNSEPQMPNKLLLLTQNCRGLNSQAKM